MTTQQWAQMSARMAAWWPATEWSQESLAIWYEDLRDLDAAEVRRALNELKQRPGAFAPSLGDVLSTIRTDAALPTADELLVLMDSVLYARVPGTFPDEISRDRAYADRGRELMSGMHPTVASFIARHGRRFHGAPMLGEDGKWNRKELAASWAAHTDAFADREVASLAAGHGDPRRLDPLAALGLAATTGPAAEKSTEVTLSPQ